MEIDNLFDFMDALRKQDAPEEFIDSDGLGDALEEIINDIKGQMKRGSRDFYNHGYKLSMDDIEVYFEESHCSCCRAEQESWTVSYQRVWDHLVKTNRVKEV